MHYCVAAAPTETNAAAVEDILSTSIDKSDHRDLQDEWVTQRSQRHAGLERQKVTFDPGRPISPWRRTNGDETPLEHG